MELLTVCIDKMNKDKFVIIHGDDVQSSTCVLHDGTKGKFSKLKHRVNTHRVFQVTLEDPRLVIKQILQYKILLSHSEKQIEFLNTKIKGHLALRSQGNMYWFDMYTQNTKLKYDEFLEVVQFTSDISDQSDRVTLNGYKNKKWVFYYIGDDLKERLSGKFDEVVFEYIPYFEAA